MHTLRASVMWQNKNIHPVYLHRHQPQGKSLANAASSERIRNPNAIYRARHRAVRWRPRAGRHGLCAPRACIVFIQCFSVLQSILCATIDGLNLHFYLKQWQLGDLCWFIHQLCQHGDILISETLYRSIHPTRLFVSIYYWTVFVVHVKGNLVINKLISYQKPG